MATVLKPRLLNNAMAVAAWASPVELMRKLLPGLPVTSFVEFAPTITKGMCASP